MRALLGLIELRLGVYIQGAAVQILVGPCWSYSNFGKAGLGLIEYHSIDPNGI